MNANLRSDLDQQPDYLLRGSMLVIARGGWIALAVVTLSFLVAAIPARFAQLRTIATEVELPRGELGPAEVRTLGELGFSIEAYAAFFTALEVGSGFSFALVAGFLFWHRSTDRRLLITSGALLSAGATIVAGLVSAPAGWRVPAEFLRAAGLASIGLFFLFPDGKFVPSWTRWATTAWITYVILATVYPPLAPPRSVVGLDTPAEAARLGVALVCLAAIAYAQIHRFRRVSGPVERQQTKWVVMAFPFITLTTAGSFLANTILSQTANTEASVLLAKLTGFTCILLSVTLFPLTVSLSMLRYRLWDVDIVINRTLVYSTLTIVLATVYFASVAVLQAGFRAITGQESRLAVVMSTLALAALFNPLRGRIQSAINRRFYRSKYDASQILSAFSAHVRDEVEVTRLSASLMEAAVQAMQPTTLSLWLRDSGEPLSQESRVRSSHP